MAQPIRPRTWWYKLDTALIDELELGESDKIKVLYGNAARLLS